MSRSTGPRARSPKVSRVRAPGMLVTLLAVVATGVAGAQPASAHARLPSTTPAVGSAVATAPEEVVLRFNEPPIGVGTVVRVTGPDDEVVSVGAARVVDDEVRQTLSTDLSGGAYRVDWRVTSDDGHPVSDTFSFTVEAGPTTPLAPSPATTAATTTSPDGATTTASPSTTSDGTGGHAAPWLVLVVVVLVATLGYPIARSTLRRHRTRKQP